MSRGFGIQEIRVIEDCFRFGAVEPAHLRMPPPPTIFGPPPVRPILHGMRIGFGTRLYSRQSINRACRKLQRAGIIDKWVNSRGVTFYLIEEAVCRQAYRVAGEVYAAHIFKIELAGASMDGIRLPPRKPRPDDNTENFTILCGAFAENLACRVYDYKDQADLIKLSKKNTRIVERLVESNKNTIARIAENLAMKRRLSAKDLTDLIENPLKGD